MIKVDDYVNKAGTKKPTGIVEKIVDNIATVRWGIADKREYREEINIYSLVVVEHEILSPAEVELRNLHNSGNHITEIKEE